MHTLTCRIAPAKGVDTTAVIAPIALVRPVRDPNVTKSCIIKYSTSSVPHTHLCTPLTCIIGCDIQWILEETA